MFYLAARSTLRDLANESSDSGQKKTEGGEKEVETRDEMRRR